MYWNFEYNRIKASYTDFLWFHFGALFLNTIIVILLKDKIFIAPSLYITMWLCKDSFNGRSIGKRKYYYQVVDERTNIVASPLQCWIRNFTFIFLHVIEIIVLLSNPQNKTWGESITHTKVVRFIGVKNKCTLKHKIEALLIIIATLVFTLITIVPLTNWLLSLDGRFNF